MKRDDRDITCKQDYTPLSNAELVAHIEQYARVLLARVEAAEATREQLADRLVFEMEQREALAARVAELEAALAARPPGYLAALDARDEVIHILHRIAALVDVPGNAPAEEIVSAVERLAAAQGWRPVTEKPTAQGRYLVWCPAPWPGYEIAPYDRGWGYVDLRFTHWQPLPPAPQEPTP